MPWTWRVFNEKDKPSLREDLTPIQIWADDNKIAFNTQRCKVVHLRHLTDYVYNFSNSLLEVS